MILCSFIPKKLYYPYSNYSATIVTTQISTGTIINLIWDVIKYNDKESSTIEIVIVEMKSNILIPYRMTVLDFERKIKRFSTYLKLPLL
jgi:hypothetical protein